MDGLALALMSPQRLRASAPIEIAHQARKSLLAMFLLMGMVSMGWVPRIPEIKDAIGLSNGQFGFILLASTFGSVTAMENLGLAEMIPLLLQYEEHAKAAGNVEIIKEEELKKMKEAVEHFDTLILKAKAFVGINASKGLDNPGKFLAANASPFGQLAGAVNAFQGKETDTALGNAIYALGLAHRSRTPDDAWKDATSGTAEDDETTRGNKNLQSTIDRRSYAMRTPMEKSKSFLDDFAKAAGVEATSITSATQMRDIMRDLKKQVDAARSRGDRVGENAGLSRLNDAQAAAQAFAGSDAGDRKVPMGRLGSDINRLLGKSGSELISDRVAEGNTILGKMEAHLRALSSARNGGAQSIWLGGSDPRAFTF